MAVGVAPLVLSLHQLLIIKLESQQMNQLLEHVASLDTAVDSKIAAQCIALTTKQLETNSFTKA